MVSRCSELAAAAVSGLLELRTLGLSCADLDNKTACEQGYLDYPKDQRVVLCEWQASACATSSTRIECSVDQTPIVAGAVAGFAVLLFLIVFLLWRLRRQRQRACCRLQPLAARHASFRAR